MRHYFKTLSKPFLMAFIVGALYAAAPAVAVAQTSMTTADIQRLQDAVYDAGRDISAARGRDARLADSLQGQLDDLRDEVTYLKVKMRKEPSVARSEYIDLRDRIDQVRSQARPEPVREAARPAPAPAPAPAPPPVETRVSATEIPVGTEFDVRLQTRLNSGTAKVEDRFDATTLAPFEKSGRILVPAGAVMRGVVNSVTPAGRGIDRKGQMTLLFDRFSVDGRTYSIRATVTQALQGENDNGRIATGAGVGAIIGGILGGVKGAIAGILIGGGGTVAATEGNEVDLAPGTVLRVRLDAPLDIGQ